MVISNDMDATEQSGIIRVDEADHFADSWIPAFEHREGVIVRKSEKFSDFYDLYECIGEGKFGKVYRCVEKATQLTLAAKTIRIKRDADRAQIENEVSIMTQMKHKCIAQIYDAFQTSNNDVILIMEIVEGGELFDRVADDSYILTELAVAMILHQLCEAIGYIHSQNIIHLDLKPENIMCVSLEGNQIKLIDFGLAHYYDGQSDLLFMAGTPEFAAPEVIKFEPLDFHTDMWSVGVIAYILLSGQSPFLGSNVALTYNNVERGDWSFCEEFNENGISDVARNFISKLLIVDKRMSEKSGKGKPGKTLDTGKLRSYVRNKHFRRLVFGVLFINTVLKMMNTMQEKKSANGMAYVKTMYNLAGRKNRNGDEAEASSSHSTATTSADINLQTEQRNGSTSINIANDGTPKVLESIRMEKRKPVVNGEALEPIPTLKITAGDIAPKPPSVFTAKKTTKVAPKSAPDDSEKAKMTELKIIKKKEAGSAESIACSVEQQASEMSNAKVTSASNSKFEETKKALKPAKSADHVQQHVQIKTSKTLPTKMTFAAKMASMLDEKATPLTLPVVSVKPHPLKDDLTANSEDKKQIKDFPSTKHVGKEATDCLPHPILTLKKSSLSAPKSAPRKSSEAEGDVKEAGASVQSLVSKMVAKTSDSSTLSETSKKPVDAVINKKNASPSRRTSTMKTKELGSVESIVAKVVGKVSEESNALSALSKGEWQKVDKSSEESATPRIPAVSLKPLQKQQQSAVLTPQQTPRTSDVLDKVSNVRTTSLSNEATDKHTLSLTAEKKTTTESKTRVTSKTVKRQTSIKTAAVEENVLTEESSCRVDHTTRKKTKKADICNTVLGNGSLEVTQTNIQKVKTESGKPSLVSGEKETSHREQLGVMKSELLKNGKRDVSGVHLDLQKTERIHISSELSKEKPPIGRCTVDLRKKVVVEKINNDQVETSTAEAVHKKELTRKKASASRKATTDNDCGFKSDSEPCEVRKPKKKVHKSTDNLLDSDCSMKPLTKKSVTFSKEILDSDEDQKAKKTTMKSGFGLMKMKSESTLHKKRFSVDVAKSADDICSSANVKPRASLQSDDEYSFANIRKQLESRIESEKSGHMWKSSTELRFTSMNSSNAKRAMNKWLSMEKNFEN